MNFYQRANLSMGLAVLLGLELAISNWLTKTTFTDDFKIVSLADEITWILFQFLFRIKVTVDDHNHFKKQGDGLSSIRRMWDFLFFSLSSLMFVLAAIFSFSFFVSGSFFIAALFLATVWVLIHGDGWKKWTFLNICYAICIFVIAFNGAGDFCIAWLPHIALCFLLFVDFIISKTASNMPEQ